MFVSFSVKLVVVFLCVCLFCFLLSLLSLFLCLFSVTFVALLMFLL